MNEHGRGDMVDQAEEVSTESLARPKIVEVIRGLDMGGAETLLFTRLRYVRKHDPELLGRTIVVNTLRTAGHYTAELQALGVEVVELRATDPLRGARELRHMLRRIGGRIYVVFHSPVASYGEKAARRLRLKGPDRLIDVVHSTRYRRAYRVLGRLLDRQADVAIAVSDDVAHAPTSAHARSVRTVVAGVDLDALRNWITANPGAPRELRASLEIDPEHQLVVAVGSLIPLKGHRFAVESLVDERLHATMLVLVGDGPERDNLQRLAEELGVAERVRFVGRVADGWRWTAVADAIVHPSEFEGLPVALMEAAALGTPIVATDVGGISQIIAYGAGGTLISKQDAQLLADAMAETLKTVKPISAVFPQRAASDSYWSMTRFVDEYYQAVEPVAR